MKCGTVDSFSEQEITSGQKSVFKTSDGVCSIEAQWRNMHQRAYELRDH